MRIRRMFIVVFICALLLMFPLPAAGEQMSTPPDSRSSPVEEWSQTFGGSSNDYGYSVAVTSDGGYIIAGYTESYGAGGYDVWLIKTGADGDEEWNQTFGGLSDDFGYSVAQTSDGGYIIAGDTLSYGAGGYDVWLIKTDADGNKEWDKTFGGSSSDCGYSIAETSDGGYIIAGYTWSYGAGNSDVWLIKADTDGNKEWDKTFGGSVYERGYSVAVTSDGGYIIAGETLSYGSGNYDVWLIKTDADGDEEWNQTFGGLSDDFGRSVAQTSDGGYIIAGYTWSYGAGSEDVWLIKVDTDGNKEWDKTFGGSSIDCSESIAKTSDGGYIIAGETLSYGSGNYDVWLVKAGDSDTTVTPGDGNGDGSVNALDITKVERVIVGLDAETLGADANGDGNINAMDITKIELIIAGLD
jgi:uncharacterized delta-60 repeat protein